MLGSAWGPSVCVAYLCGSDVPVQVWTDPSKVGQFNGSSGMALIYGVVLLNKFTAFIGIRDSYTDWPGICPLLTLISTPGGAWHVPVVHSPPTGGAW